MNLTAQKHERSLPSWRAFRGKTQRKKEPPFIRKHNTRRPIPLRTLPTTGRVRKNSKTVFPGEIFRGRIQRKKEPPLYVNITPTALIPLHTLPTTGRV